MSEVHARPSVAYYVAIAALVVGVGTGLGLFWLLTTGEGRATATYSVGDAIATTCPPGTGATVCYGFEVTNSGNAGGAAACAVTSAEGTRAVFANDETTTQVALQPNETRQVIIKVVAAGADVIRPPELACA